MTAKPPLTTAEHIARAKAHLAEGAYPDFATAHALVAIAELMATNTAELIVEATTRGAVATAEAIGTILDVVNPGGPIQTNVNTNTTEHFRKLCLTDPANWPDNPDGSCPGCGVPVDGIHLDTCPVYLARLRGGNQ